MSGDRKIFLISMVKNEEDIIESFVRYHAKFFDGLIIIDNKSSDDTFNILKQLKKEGVPLYLHSDGEPSYLQTKKMNNLLYATINQFHPDIIVPLDADEFLVPADPAVDLRQIMNNLDLTKVGHVKWVTHVLTKEDNSEELFVPARMKYILHDEKKEFKVILPAHLTEEKSLALIMGNHRAITRNPQEKFEGIIIGQLKLAHYPYRSTEQIISKILVGWINNLARYDLVPGQGFHWGLLYNKILQGEAIGYLELINEAYKHCIEYELPVKLEKSPLGVSTYGNITLKYTKNRPVNYLSNLANNSALLAEKYASLQKNIVTNVEMGYALMASLCKENMFSAALKVNDMILLFDSNPILFYYRAEICSLLKKNVEAVDNYNKFLSADNIDKYQAEKDKAQVMLKSLQDNSLKDS